MNIDKALEHFEWKFKNVWKASKKDVEAFNSILEWKEQQESRVMFENESLCKLWVHQLMLLNETEMYSAERAIQIIDEILSKSTYDWCLKLKEQTNIMRFRTLLSSDEYKAAIRDLKPVKAAEIGSKTLDNISFETKEITEDNIIKFVNSQINRVINKFDK